MTERPIRRAEDVATLLDGLERVRADVDRMTISFVRARLIGEENKIGFQGCVRRMRGMVEGIRHAFRLIPPDQGKVPEKEVNHLATLIYQANVFHAYGLTDNLAQIWQLRHVVKDKKGRPLRKTRLGLTPGHTEIRNSLPAGFRDRLAGLDPWFAYLEEFRHAVAHGIPLYLPPYMVDPSDVPAYLAAERAAKHALLRGDEHAEQAAKAESRRYRHFKPFVVGSVIDELRSVDFHAQLITDLVTAIELTDFMLDALNTGDDVDWQHG